MKKLMMLILGVLLFIPAIVLADMGAPSIRAYKVTPKSEEGATCYGIKESDWGNSTAEFEKKGIVKYKEEVAIQIEETWNGEVYGTNWEEGSDDCYYKLSEFKVVGESTDKDEAVYAGKVFAKDGVEIYEGPASAYEKTGKKIPYGTDVATSDFLDYSTWVYVEYGDIKGYVNAENGGLGILYKKDVISGETSKEYNSFYQLDNWSRAIMVKDGESYIKLYQNMENPGYATKFFYKNEMKIANEWKLQKKGDFDSEAITTIPKGETVTILYHGGPNCTSYDYVSYKDQKGWINYRECGEEEQPYESYENLVESDDYMEWNEGKVLYDTYKEEQTATKKNSSSKAKDPNTILITSICAGGAIVLTSIVTIILVNKKKKTTEE